MAAPRAHTIEIFDAPSGVRWFLPWADAREFALACAFLDLLAGGRFGDPDDAARPAFYCLETIAQLDALAAFRRDVIAHRDERRRLTTPDTRSTDVI